MGARLSENPCKDCTRRSVGCHARCGEYQSWRALRDKMLEDEAKEKQLSVAYSDLKRHLMK